MPHSNNARFSILTTCKPSKHYKEFVKFNELVLCCQKHNWPCILLNSEDEIPDELTENHENALINPQSPKNRRPTLKRYVDATDSDWLIIGNSDVWINANWELVIQCLEKNNIQFASSRRWDLPTNIRISNLSNCENSRILLLKNIAKYQSYRTLDVFIIRRQILELAILLNDYIGSLVPGTVGFDNNFFGLLAGFTKTADLSSVISIFHTNHEDFRAVFYRSHIISLERQVSFIDKRSHERKLLTRKGCLSYADCKIVISDGLFTPVCNKNKKLRYLIRNLCNRLINNLNVIIFITNNITHRLILSTNFLKPSFCCIFTIILVYPSIHKIGTNKKDNDLGRDLKNFIDKKVNQWLHKNIT